MYSCLWNAAIDDAFMAVADHNMGTRKTGYQTMIFTYSNPIPLGKK